MDNLNNDKQNNITLNSGTNVTINKQNDTRTINSTGSSGGVVYTNTYGNIDINNNTMDLENSIQTQTATLTI